ncbi:MAG TPA: BREX system ATP-binding domain-containing protein [Gemmatimonadaceae bacterium]|nr:BREX system ATP-binding domain-containing protein [Gemmatimonadaceae bacterium]
MATSPSRLPPAPLVGRSEELTELAAALQSAAAGRGRTIFLVGEGGVGKTRLATAVAEHATKMGFAVAHGRAYPVETGVPYALFADALLPTLRALDPSTLTTLTRGGSAELTHLFPALATSSGTRTPDAARGDPAEFKSRLLWNFAQFLARYSARKPLLVVLENLQWADASSLELLHFVARQAANEKLTLLCTYNETERDQSAILAATERSLLALQAATVTRLRPLSEDETNELLQRTFNTGAATTSDFGRRLHSWTRGNPFFIEETLKAFVAEGALHEQHGRWVGWELEHFALPNSIRDALVGRFARLNIPARGVAEMAAVLGTRASLEALEQVAGMDRELLLGALSELRAERVLAESTDGEAVVDDFTHPLLQDVLYGELGIARARVLHERVAEALERHYGDGADAHADELALHFARAASPRLASRAVKYLATAGRHALEKHANREAANYLGAALEHARRSPALLNDAAREALTEDLARARQRLGEYESAVGLWTQLRDDAERTGRGGRVAAIERRLGLAAYWSGNFPEALAHFDAGLVSARAAGEAEVGARIALAKGVCLVEVGRRDEAEVEVRGALEAAEKIGSPALLARVHRALLLLYAWTGPADLAREHGTLAIGLARESGNRALEATVHWTLAMLGGLTGNSDEVARHLGEAIRLADELRSPLLRVWAAEIEIEYAAATGDWDAAIAISERTITLARALGQRALLPRVLVWSALVYFGRGEIERGKALVDEADTLAGGTHGGRRPADLHTRVPVLVGRAAYALATRDFKEAIHIGESALAIVDRTGYVVWAIHRLLPLVAEASLWANALHRAERLGERLRIESTRLGHKLGMAWADACDALVKLLQGDAAGAVTLLRDAAERLEAIPFVPDAARLRRQLARALTETDDREGAARELRRAHDVFARLGAQPELDATREQLRALGARPPARVSLRGAEGLTGRELEIVRLVASRKSNKEIGTALGISPRTVSTHLSNIFEKMSVTSRAELADVARQHLIATA